MSSLRELYQEVILDHYKNPRNHCVLENATNMAQGRNPLCGDELKVYLNINKDIIESVSFVGGGCAIAQASASLMTEIIAGKSIKEAHALFEAFHILLTKSEGDVDAAFGKLCVLAGVREFPARVKCATLAWHTLEAALKQNGDTVCTE